MNNLRSCVRRHAQGYVKGEEWPALPPEADLGLDKRLKSMRPPEERRPESTMPRPSRPRSRSHSLGRVMQELDDEAAGEGDVQEAEGMAETFEVARSSGQSVQDALATIAVVYETDETGVKQKLRQYVRSTCKKKDGRHAGVCLEILTHMRDGSKEAAGDRTEEVRKLASSSEPIEPPPTTRAAVYHQPFAPPPGLGDRTGPGGPAIRSLEGDSGRNPLLGSDGLVNQLFGGPEAHRAAEEIEGRLRTCSGRTP